MTNRTLTTEYRPKGAANEKLVFNVEELAKALCISKNTAYELVRSGKVRSVRIGRQFRIPRDAVWDFLNAGQ